MAHHPKTILTFGETLWDLLPDGRELGGAPFNFAYRVNGLGDQGLMVSRLGCDDLGDHAWSRITDMGMDTACLQRDPDHPTGTVPVTLDQRGNPTFTIIPNVAYDYIERTDALLAAAAKADCICYGTLAQRRPVSRATVEALLDAAPNAVKLLDINFRPDCYTDDTITTSLQRADILKCNHAELTELAELFSLPRDVPAFCHAMIDRWALTHCVVTLGERGAFAASPTAQAAYVPGLAVDVVDTCGSGDAFTAGFIHRHLRRAALADSLRMGNAVGALVATQRGGTAPITPDDVAVFIAASRHGAVEPSLAPFAVPLTQ